MCLPVSRFRPLPGTYISQSEGQSDTQNRDCFRPLPGTYISQLLHGTSKSGRKFVSVPYRGLIFLNSYEEISKEELAKFPSPTGDLYFSMRVFLVW